MKSLLFRSCLCICIAFPSSFVTADIQINESENNFTVATGNYTWTLSKTSFNVIDQAKVNDTIMLEGGEVSLNFQGNTLSFEEPSEFLFGSDWVELRGWASLEKKLWYVARYKFWDDKPYTHLAISFTDRQETYVAESPGSYFWRNSNRDVSNFKITLNTSSSLPTQRYEQKNAFSGGAVTDPEIEFVAYDNVGSYYQWRRYVRRNLPSFDERIIVHHKASGNGTNQVIWKPKFTGVAELEAYYLTHQYAAQNVTYEIHHANGMDTVVVPNQGDSDTINLGSFTLDQESKVVLKDTGIRGRTLYAEALHIIPEDTELSPVIVKPKRLSDNVLSTGPYSLVVQDLWQRHPIAVFSNEKSLGVEAILKPTRLMGGMGMTLDLAIGIDGNSHEAQVLLDAPPERTLPDWWHTVDGNLSSSAEYDDLVAMTSATMKYADEYANNFGWKNWGDFQIGASNDYNEGTDEYYQAENWGNLQYDLATGLMLAYLRTGDPETWHRAKAAVRHMMDVDFVKFMPYADKNSMTIHRKGECTASRAHNCQVPNTAFGYAWRGFLLYYHLTGEEWAKELAQMSIDHAAFYVVTYLNHDAEWLMKGTYGYGPHRATAWVIRALAYGAKVFPEGSKYFSKNTQRGTVPEGTSYQALANQIVTRAISDADEKGGIFSGMQPVWSAQNTEALAVYHEIAPDEQKAAIEQIILATADYFMNEAFRVTGDGDIKNPSNDVELYYSLNSSTWREGDIYTWLWLSTFAMAYQYATPDEKEEYATFSQDLFEYARQRYKQQTRHQTPRPWSGMLGFPAAFVEILLSRDTQAPTTPTGFNAELIKIE